MAVSKCAAAAAGAYPRLCSFLVLVLFARIDMILAEDIGGKAIHRNATAEKTAAANKLSGNVKPLSHSDEKPLPVYLEIGGLDRHWKDAGISWRIESVLPPDEVEKDGQEAVDAPDHHVREDVHAAAGRRMQRDRISGGVAADEGLMIGARGRIVFHQEELQQILRGFDNKVVKQSEKRKRYGAGDSPARGVGRRQKEAEFAGRAALKLEDVKAMMRERIENARRSKNTVQLAPVELLSLQTPSAPHFVETMAKGMPKDGQRDRRATEYLQVMEEGRGSNSHEEELMTAMKALKLDFLEAFTKKKGGAPRRLTTNNNNKSLSTGFAGGDGEGTKNMAKLSSRRILLDQISRKMSARHVGIVLGTALNRPADRQFLFSAGRASAFLPASDTTQHQILDQHGAHVMYRFLLAPHEQQYRLIFETVEDPSRNLKTATTKKNSLPVGDVLDSPTAFVSLTVGDRVSLLRSEGLDLLSGGTTLTFYFSLTSQQLQQNDRRDLGDSKPERPTFPPRETPPTPSPLPQTTARPASQATPNPVPLSTPVPGGVTPAPGTRPPSLGGPTIPPSISAAPSFSPTVEPLCVSQTNGPVSFDGLFWAIRLDKNNVNGGLEEWLGPVLSDLAETYTAVATCDQKGAFRTMTRVDLIEIHEGGTTSSEVEVIVQLVGSCEGCNTVPVELFRRTQESAKNLGENRRELANPCVCPGPSRVAFMEAYNSRNQTTALGDLLDVVDVYRVANCTPGAVEDLVQQHTASVSVFLTRDPEMAGAAVSTEEQDTIIANFLISFHEAASFAEGTCDLARRNILTVLPDDANTKQQRNRRLPGTAQTSDDVELHLLVTFECYGCDGQLFGKVDVQNSTNCLCPVETTQQGVRDRGLIGPLTEALRDVLLDSGGTQDIAISQFVPDTGITTTTQVADVMQTKEVDCGSSFSVFSAVVVVEYDLIPNTTAVSEDDIALLETQFVKGYNGLARRYCDPYFRRLSSAEALFYHISDDVSKVSFEFSVVGTCRGDCNETIPVYDPEAFRRTPSRERRLAWKQHRTLRSLQQLDPTCYCSATSPIELGPSEPEVVQNYQALVNRFELETISEVADCRFLTSFRSAVVLNINGSVDTQDQLNQLGRTFVDSYNQAISEGFCDSFFRHLTDDFEISSNVTINEGNVVNSTGQGNRKRSTRILFAPERRAQMSSLAPTFAPTVAPTGDLNQTFTGDLNLTVPVSGSAENLVLLQVSGTCRGCTSDSGLFDQTSGRRRNLQEGGADNQGSSGLLKARVESCFCPPNSTRLEPSQDQVLLALSSLPFIDNATLEEVRIVPCAFEESDFSTTIVIDAYVSGDVTSNDEDLISKTFISEYTELSADYCDVLFRRPETILSIDHETLAEIDENGFPRVRFFLKLEGSCRGCRPNGDLFDDRRNRRLDDLVPDRRRTQSKIDGCFCPGDAPYRAIREDEFQEGYAEVFASGRRLQGGQLQFDNTIILAWVGQLTGAPSMAALDASILNFLKYPNCVVPPGTEHYIGDGYCDRATIPNTDPPEYIYNVLNCGYDGGDCCASECQTGLTYVCGQFGYACHLDNFVDTGNGVDPMAAERTGVSNSCPTTIESKAICTANPFCQPTSFCGDGWCDSVLNNAACGYDGGDCCEDTCMDSSPYWDCGVVGYPCVDPCSNSPPSNACKFLWIGDGWCDLENNNAACNYDGGDCCSITCNGDLCGWLGYDCQDPDVLDLLGRCNGFIEGIGDGFCDFENNNADCAYDGGDCCFITCNGDLCGIPAYDCQDPDALPLFQSCNGDVNSIGDGFCNFDNNNPDCAYDDGDCCAITCNTFTCGWFGYDCQDPDVLPLFQSCNGDVISIGDGFCNFENNNADCAYDGGDCCATTCDAFFCGAFGYDCQDPAELKNPLRNCLGYIDLVGDGWCISINNNADCDYDGGDCCESTCNPRARFTCGFEGYGCCDPSQTSDYLGDGICVGCPALGGVPQYVGDGWCDDENNNAICKYDGGDCCPNTCDSNAEYDCGVVGYTCCDPLQTSDYLGDGICLQCENAGGYLPWISDGYCDDENNNAICGYDGGDCCPNTCDSNADCGNAGYTCCDPLQTSDYLGDSLCIQCKNAGGYRPWFRDGWCDMENMNAACKYDGGDCCPNTCDSNAEYDCGVAGYACCDPSETLYYLGEDLCQGCPAAGGYASFISDGECDLMNNIAECRYDGGDCCENTCGPSNPIYDCGVGGYLCCDPLQTSDYLGDGVCIPQCDLAGGNPSSVGDGWCDSYNNISACEYDGGDCAPTPCVAGNPSTAPTPPCGVSPMPPGGGGWTGPAAGAAAAFVFDTPPPSSKPSDAPSAEPSTKRPLFSDQPPSTESPSSYPSAFPSSYPSEFPSSYPTAAPAP